MLRTNHYFIHVISTDIIISIFMQRNMAHHLMNKQYLPALDWALICTYLAQSCHSHPFCKLSANGTLRVIQRWKSLFLWMLITIYTRLQLVLTWLPPIYNDTEAFISMYLHIHEYNLHPNVCMDIAIFNILPYIHQQGLDLFHRHPRLCEQAHRKCLKTIQ
jgi:hypothetical protein